MKRILFITGTRADYGKIKSLIKAVESDSDLEAFIFVSGMHLIETYGNTYKEVLKDGYENVYTDFSQCSSGIMSYDLGNIVCDLTGYVKKIRPDLIVVHGDRIDALAGAIVGALNNILVAHIEGGELSGTIDESIRHAVSKFSHLHFVSNEDARKRLIQMGEAEERIYMIGSPDIDIMLSDNLPSLEMVKEKYNISYSDYAICMYHPVTTEFDLLQGHVNQLIEALIESADNFVMIYPNNDYGSEIILNSYRSLRKNKRFVFFPSMRLEYFLTLMKNALYMIGNSSAGIRETGIYGIPAIDVGSRQSGRYSIGENNLQHVDENKGQILNAIKETKNYRIKSCAYGNGKSTGRFMEVLKMPNIWEVKIQKHFIDANSTM